jgi:competence protein ComEC
MPMNGSAPSTAFRARQTALADDFRRIRQELRLRVEALLERERGQLPLWVPVLLGAGICAWFALPVPAHWLAWSLGWLGFGLLAAALSRNGGRLSGALAAGAVLLGAGCLLSWGKSLIVGSPPLARPAVVTMEARVFGIERLVARDVVRLQLEPIDRPDLPRGVRVNLEANATPIGLTTGDHVRLRARLMPPPSASVPGGYDYALRAYFAGIGATGRALGPITITAAGPRDGWQLRERLGRHVASQMEGGAGAIAVALANGDQSGISEEDAEAMRRSGLAHLLSISGLHVSALIGATVLIVVRLLALWPRIAVRWPLLLIAAGCGAAAGIGYTLLTGAQVPTVRSCIAALLVMGGLALGREAISLRLVAVGALIVMVFWPEAVIGPSFQMSFAAVVAIIACYEYAPVRRLIERREETRVRRLGRSFFALLLTGIAVELVLAPIAIYHFHRAGLLGSLANLVAIPLTSFVIMPAEAMALLLDVAGLGAPAWWVVQQALDLLLALAHGVAALPFAIARVPTISVALFAITMLGLLWLMLWQTRLRWVGLLPALGGLVLIAASPSPDVVVTGDGRHVGVMTDRGQVALLRDRAGDYTRDMLDETMAADPADHAAPIALADLPGARCSQDMCTVRLNAGEKSLTMLVARSRLLIPIQAMNSACASADIVIADRTLPRSCMPRWLKLDRQALSRTGGVAIYLAGRRVVTTHDPRDAHPWIIPPRAPRPTLPHAAGDRVPRPQ